MVRSPTFVSWQRRKDSYWSVPPTSTSPSCFRMLPQVAGKGMGDIDGAAYASGWGSWNVSQVFINYYKSRGLLTLSYAPFKRSLLRACDPSR